MEIKLKQTTIKQSRRNYNAKNLRERKLKIDNKAIQYLNNVSQQIDISYIKNEPHDSLEQSVLNVRPETILFQKFGMVLTDSNPEYCSPNKIKINLMSQTHIERTNSLLRSSQQSATPQRRSSAPKKRDYFLSVVSRLPSMRRASTHFS